MEKKMMEMERRMLRLEQVKHVCCCFGFFYFVKCDFIVYYFVCFVFCEQIVFNVGSQHLQSEKEKEIVSENESEKENKDKEKYQK